MASSVGLAGVGMPSPLLCATGIEEGSKGCGHPRPRIPACQGLLNTWPPENRVALWTATALQYGAGLFGSGLHVGIELRAAPAAHAANLPGFQPQRPAKVRAFHLCAVEFRLPQNRARESGSAQICTAQIGIQEN